MELAKTSEGILPEGSQQTTSAKSISASKMFFFIFVFIIKIEKQKCLAANAMQILQ